VSLFRTPTILNVDQQHWKERNGNLLISMFFLNSHHIGWRGLIHGGITSGIFDDIFAHYCYSESPETFPLTKTLQVGFAKPDFPGETLFVRVTKIAPPLEMEDASKKSKKLWVQARLETVRNEVFTLATAEALFILCEQLPDQPRHEAVTQDTALAQLPQQLRNEVIPQSIPQTERSFTDMPPELWQAVVQDLPSFTGSHAAQVFDFKLRDHQRKHSDICGHIFKDEKWCSTVTRQGLNPVLVGDDLHKLYDNPQQSAYLALLTGDKTRNLRHENETSGITETARFQ
jgi:hypothetical protein